MRILALSDPHGTLPDDIDRLLKEDIDVIVCTGDFAGVKRFKDGSGKTDSESQARILRKLASLDLPVLVLKGNMYNSRETKKIFTDEINKYSNIHYKETGKLRVKGKDFVFFDMIWEEHYTPDNTIIKRKLRNNDNRRRRLDALLKQSDDPIVLAHTPPYKVLDWSKRGFHAGSKILLEAIKKYHPPIVLCGHIHEGEGVSQVGKTIVYNLGCCGKYKIVEV
ncbi:MAG: metallophosphoesterase family protein [Nanobdellota archaeon]